MGSATPARRSKAVHQLTWGVAAAPLPGQQTSGDVHVVKEFPGGVLVAVIDALGHGVDAARTAQIAADTLEQQAHESPSQLLQRCQRVLKGTRGAVMSLASINWDEHVMTWVGVGDVAGVLIVAAAHGSGRETYLLARGGIVGSGDPLAARPWVIPLAAGDTLIFATDGVRAGFSSAAGASDDPQAMADYILRRYNKGTDDALVLVARYPGNGGGE